MSRRDPLAGISAVHIGNDRPAAKKERAAVEERETAKPPSAPLPREVLDAPPSPSVPETPESPPAPAPVEPPPEVASSPPVPVPPHRSAAGKLGAALGGLFRRKKG